LLARRKANPRVAMTGEISLRGAVLPIGGLKEKALGAQRDGVQKILVPAGNWPDVEDLPSEVRNAIDFVAVQEISQGFNALFRRSVDYPDRTEVQRELTVGGSVGCRYIRAGSRWQDHPAAKIGL
jgi:ATP-dependent Lon protease